MTTPPDSAAAGTPSRGGSTFPPRPGAVVAGQYVVEEVVGRGPEGCVCHATQLRSGKRVVLKLLAKAANGTAGAEARQREERFLEVGNRLMRFRHDALVPVVDSGLDPDLGPFVAAEIAEGRSLDSLAKEGGPLPPWRAATIVHRVLLGLHAAHDQGVIHGDLRPEYIILADPRSEGGEQPRVVDFGVSRALRSPHLQEGAIPGAPPYMAPEWREEEGPLDGRADVYAMATVLHHLLTGQYPFPFNPAGMDRRAWLDYLAWKSTADPSPPGPLLGGGPCPSSMVSLLLRGLARRPADRYHTAAEMARDLKPFLVPEGWTDDGVPALAEAAWIPLPSSPSPSPVSSPSRSFPVQMVSVVWVALLMGGLSLFLLSSPEPPPEKEPSPLPDLPLVRIPAGRFQMGSPPDEEGRASSEKLHSVEITKDFLIGSTEIPQGVWQAVMDSNPSSRPGSRLPVDSVSWRQAVDFCNALSERAGLRPAYLMTPEGVHWDREAPGYRLPSEAEWEYAARAGASSPWGGDPETLAWYGQKGPREVGMGGSNDWGLHDMGGNVWEWVYDGWREDPPGGRDPVVVELGDRGTLRGGSWRGSLARVRLASRAAANRGLRSADRGFRVARNAP